MSYTADLERYIFNSLKRYFFFIQEQRYVHDVLQEIRIAIFTSEDEKESLRAAGRGCYRLGKEYGYRREFTDLDTPFFDSENSKKDYLTGDSEDSDGGDNTGYSDEDSEGDNILSRAIILYGKSKDAKEVCWKLGINYSRQLENQLATAYVNNN